MTRPEKSHPLGERMHTRSVISLDCKNFVKNTFGFLHQYIYIIICSCIMFLHLHCIMMMMAFLNIFYYFCYFFHALWTVNATRVTNVFLLLSEVRKVGFK